MATASEPSRHKCLIYDGHPSEQLPVVVPLLLDGLEDNFRCLYLGSPDAIEMIDQALLARGVDTAAAKQRGALVFSADRSHLVDGAFDPRAMIDSLCASIDDAVKDGFAGLCATGDMRWEIGDDTRNVARLLEYEARLEQVFRDRPLRGICQYHRDILPAEAVRDALVSHRAAYIGHLLNRDNLFYVPPELLLASEDASKRQGEWMCQQIIRVLDAERVRDRALAQLEELNQNLERRVAERTADLEIANRQLEAFAYSVSHDLRAPLRAVGGFTEILAAEAAAKLDPAERGHLERVRHGARQMEDLIEGMLELARVAKVELTSRTVDLAPFVVDAVHHLKLADPARHVEVEVMPELCVRGDPTLLRSVIGNLVENAWKFSAKREQARIEVGKLGEEAGQLTMFVRDNGAGFDMQYASKLFGVFQRLHSESEFRGTGVGLATVQRIVSRHGGRVWAEAVPDQGATFYFTLPAATSSAASDR